MRRRIQVAVVLLLGLMVIGMAIIAINRVRHSADRMMCSSKLKQMGVALYDYRTTHGHYPTGTVRNADLPPDRRLSWLTEIHPNFIVAGPITQFNKTKAWDSTENCPVYGFVFPDPPQQRERVLLGDATILLCPANPPRSDPGLPSPTHYVGVAGVGDDAAMLPLSDRRAGFFGYDRKITEREVVDGLSNTIAVAEVLDGGPWTAGGRATVRGLEASGVPYLGEGGQFASHHGWGHNLALSWPIATNILFADGSGRWITASVSPHVFEALTTIAGGEKVELPDER